MTDRTHPDSGRIITSSDVIADLHARIAELEAQIEALSGVQALSAAPAIGDELRDTLVAVSAAIAERDDRAAQKMICEILAASTTPPAEQPIGEVVVTKDEDGQIVAVTRQDDEGHILSVIATCDPAEQQAAPKAAPGEQNTVPAEWLEQAYREGWAACRDAETIGEEAEDWAFGNSTANSRMIDAQQAAPKQEAQEPAAYVHVPHSTVEGKVRPVVSFEKYQQDYADGIYSTRIPLYTAPQPAPADLEQLRERIARMGLDVDRAMRGHVNEQSPLGTQRLAAIAALVKPKPAPPSDDVVKDAARYRFLAGHCRSTSEHWGGRWSIVVDGPAPKSHDSEDDFDEAVDAAIAAQRGNK
ncbi:hypothetical protein J1N44_17925 [Acidovorax temperans]|uniref:hypothetical protein n=1 Tax=Acidovorax temperans TaxID=80878 RepID=UPI001A941503|nr:hypothetical protein [Acidovorax temperans]MBO0943536.1 hypothetical protein [Acidovorax temperans]